MFIYWVFQYWSIDTIRVFWTLGGGFLSLCWKTYGEEKPSQPWKTEQFLGPILTIKYQVLCQFYG